MGNITDICGINNIKKYNYENANKKDYRNQKQRKMAK